MRNWEVVWWWIGKLNLILVASSCPCGFCMRSRWDPSFMISWRSIWREPRCLKEPHYLKRASLSEGSPAVWRDPLCLKGVRLSENCPVVWREPRRSKGTLLFEGSPPRCLNGSLAVWGEPCLNRNFYWWNLRFHLNRLRSMSFSIEANPPATPWRPEQKNRKT